MILKCQYCLANISATKAPIITKFETYAHEDVMDYQQNSGKDLFTQAHTLCVNVLARNNTCARMCARFLLVVHYILMSISLNDRSFRCGDICQTILTF